MEANTVILPDFHAICPWKTWRNPHEQEATAASLQWALGFKSVDVKKAEWFRKASSGLLCAYAHPYASPERLRTACDFVNLLIGIDEINDEQHGGDVAVTASIVISALVNDDYEDPSLLCQMTKRYVANRAAIFRCTHRHPIALGVDSIPLKPQRVSEDFLD